MQNKELFKSVSSTETIDKEGASSHHKDEHKTPGPTDSSTPLLLVQNPASAIHRGATQHVARSTASNMRGTAVLERGPAVATEEESFTFNPYASKELDRARSKFPHSQQSSMSVPAYGMPLPTEPVTSSIEDDTVSNPQKSLRSAAVDIQVTSSQSQRGWGRPIIAGIMAFLLAGIGIGTRRRAASKENDIERGETYETTPLLSVAKDRLTAMDSCHLDDTMTMSTPPVLEARRSPHKAILVSSAVLMPRAEEDVSTEEEKDLVRSAMQNQKEAADAKRAWLKVLRNKRRARRQKRLLHFKAMKKIRLQRLKAARERTKRKMQIDFGIPPDPGLEKRNAQDRNEGSVPQRGFRAKDPHRQLSLAMRLLRITLRARRMRRVRRTTKKQKKTIANASSRRPM